MSPRDEHDDGEQHNDEEGEQANPPDASFKDEAEAADVTITQWVELDEDEEDDEEFDPEAAVDEEDGEEDDEDEEEEEDDDEEVEIDEEERKALQEEAAAGLEAGTGESDDAEGDEQADGDEGGGEGEDEDGEDGNGEEDEEDVSVLESGAGMMSGASMSSFVSSVMRKDGPTVSTVLLKADGTKEELVRLIAQRHARQLTLLPSQPIHHSIPLRVCVACLSVAGYDTEGRLTSAGHSRIASPQYSLVELRDSHPVPACICVLLVDAAGRVLQGKTSFLGQYAGLDVIILTRRDQEDNQLLPRNQHTVRHAEHPLAKAGAEARSAAVRQSRLLTGSEAFWLMVCAAAAAVRRRRGARRRAAGAHGQEQRAATVHAGGVAALLRRRRHSAGWWRAERRQAIGARERGWGGGEGRRGRGLSQEAAKDVSDSIKLLLRVYYIERTRTRPNSRCV